MPTNFEKAFSSARKGGKKEFSFGGKKYNTKLKGEGGGSKKQKLPSKGPVPNTKPNSGPGRKPTPKAAKVSGAAGKPAVAAAEAKVKVPTAIKRAVKIQTGPKTKSYADRYKKPQVRMGSGGGY